MQKCFLISKVTTLHEYLHFNVITNTKKNIETWILEIKCIPNHKKRKKHFFRAIYNGANMLLSFISVPPHLFMKYSINTSGWLWLEHRYWHCTHCMVWNYCIYCIFGLGSDLSKSTTDKMFLLPLRSPQQHSLSVRSSQRGVCLCVTWLESAPPPLNVKGLAVFKCTRVSCIRH